MRFAKSSEFRLYYSENGQLVTRHQLLIYFGAFYASFRRWKRIWENTTSIVTQTLKLRVFVKTRTFCFTFWCWAILFNIYYAFKKQMRSCFVFYNTKRTDFAKYRQWRTRSNMLAHTLAECRGATTRNFLLITKFSLHSGASRDQSRYT